MRPRRFLQPLVIRFDSCPFQAMLHKGKIVAAAVLLLMALALRLVLKKQSQYDAEKQWFVDHLGYAAVLRVDSVVTFHTNGNGFLMCSVDSGKINYHREDSLNRQLQHYRRLLFLRTDSTQVVRLFSGSTPAFQKGDIVRINSATDRYEYFRGDELLRSYRLSEAVSERHF